jgi:hypothetical protein
MVMGSFKIYLLFIFVNLILVNIARLLLRLLYVIVMLKLCLVNNTLSPWFGYNVFCDKK